MLCHCLIFSVDVGEETPRTVCSGLVGSVPLEELQVWPFGSSERVDLKKTNKQTNKQKQKTSSYTFNTCIHVQGNFVKTAHVCHCFRGAQC